MKPAGAKFGGGRLICRADRAVVGKLKLRLLIQKLGDVAGQGMPPHWLCSRIANGPQTSKVSSFFRGDVDRRAHGLDVNGESDKLFRRHRQRVSLKLF